MRHTRHERGRYIDFEYGPRDHSAAGGEPNNLRGCPGIVQCDGDGHRTYLSMEEEWRGHWWRDKLQLQHHQHFGGRCRYLYRHHYGHLYAAGDEHHLAANTAL